MYQLSLVPESKLRCSRDRGSIDLFFSLVDYRNSYFTSNDPRKIFEFYEGFKDREELIEWMRERPKGVSYIHETEGNKDVIVVIPTADYNGKLAKSCREEIFKGLHVIFVESGISNHYFSYEHNCNTGIKKALEYNPKWIIISNDDVIKIDDSSILVRQLGSLSGSNSDVVFVTENVGRHSNTFSFKKITKISLYIARILHLFKIKISRSSVIYLHGKFNSLYFVYPLNGDLVDKLFPTIFSYKNVEDFFIVSGSFARKNEGILFDEMYINGYEDQDFSLVKLKECKLAQIAYKIGSYTSATMSRGLGYSLRNVANGVYFNSRIKDLTIRQSKILSK
jgi:hypothetical protein